MAPKVFFFFLIFDTNTRELFSLRNVIFYESIFPFKTVAVDRQGIIVHFVDLAPTIMDVSSYFLLPYPSNLDISHPQPIHHDQFTHHPSEFTPDPHFHLLFPTELAPSNPTIRRSTHPK